MWRVLIVDDDRNFRYALREVIPWSAHDFVVAAEAVHGQQALNILRRESIQLVLTDMEMPLLNGVELTRAIRREYPDIVIVALSAFDDISYVRESLKLGAADYILKQEFDPERVMETLLRLRREHTGRGQEELTREQSRDELYRYLLGSIPAISETNLYAQRLLGGDLTVCIAESEADPASSAEEFLQENVQRVELLCYMKVSMQRCFFLLRIRGGVQGRSGNEAWNEIISRIRAMYPERVSIGIPDAAGDAAALPSIYRKADIAIGYFFFEPKRQVFHYLDFRDVERNRERSRSCVPEDDCSANDIDGQLAACCEKMWTYFPSPEQIDSDLLLLLRRYAGAIGAAGSLEELHAYESLRALPTLDAKLERIRGMASQLRERLEGGYSGRNPEIRAAFVYLQEHFAEDLSLADLAAHVSLSEHYFSNLFKKETGESFTACLNRIRIEKAKALFRDPSRRVYEVAEAVGYQSATYFTTIFRKVTGCSVSDFRREHAGP